LAVPDARYFEPELETLPRAELEALQEQRLLELLPYAYERAGLYRETWDAAGVHPRDIRSLDDFRERIPFIDKDAIRAYRDRCGDPFGGLLCIDPADLTSVMSSSGTTGDATLFAERWDEYPPLPTGFARDLWELGVRPGDYVLGGGAGMFRGRIDSVYQLLGAIPLVVETSGGHWPEVFEVIRRYRPTYLQLVGPIVVELEHQSAEHDLREIFSCFKAASFAGEPLGARMRDKIRNQWGLELFIWTSAGDTGTAWECRAHDGCHLWEDTVLAEHLDPERNRAVGDGEIGELVATSLDNRVAPLIRYRTDDLVRLTRARCACGRTHARQWPLGRKGDETLVRGRAILPLDVWAAIEQLDETATGLFQIIRAAREVEELRIRVGYNPQRTRSLASLEERLRAAVAEAVGVEPRLELVTEQEILARSTSTAKLPRVARS
jgi:phenylacetate-CoA ligase